ncbi:MAG: aminopeptidase P family protein, partial [Gammaproteobacteria bacterium]|nr:aminopeptidase P family protein [Gammaproteobacteria bacterium]
MACGIGGSTAEKELTKLYSVRDQAVPISVDEHLSRIDRLRNRMKETGVDALYLDATTSLRYFTGLYCYPGERLHGAIITA